MTAVDRKIIVFRVGWMEYYRGPEGDTIKSSAEFIQSEGFGYELYNFLPYQGYMYGFVQPSGRGDPIQREIRIERLGADRGAASVDGVVVAWVAPEPNGGGTFLVGWYENATVFRQYQEPPVGSGRTYKNLSLGYYAKAAEDDCVLLPLEERTLPVPSARKKGPGGIGRSCVWFADGGKPNDVKFRRELLDFIGYYSSRRFESDLNETFFSTESVVLKEGAPRKVATVTYARSRKARKICIEHYGAKCVVCGFDFSDFYGDVGAGYIHVHHRYELSDVGTEHEIDPIRDLRPVCPNCHAMIHRRTPPYTIEEIRRFVQEQKMRSTGV